ncbi:MAG: flagellar hook-basal body complex protein [Deltaproteobacteria bacterium]|nr:flagellar hook-basal body complex protein [Deltaproteobacteria bacterium]
MSSALWIGTTGLSAASKQMDVIGNNLANSNTIGFKAGDTAFASMLSQSLSGGSGNQQVGQGVGVAAISTSFAQGSYETTGSATDLAIDGTGFFIVKNSKDDLTYYTRAGSFFLNSEGDLVDLSGYEVQGRMFDDGGVESTSLTSVNLTGRKSTPNETTKFELGVNLDSELETTDNPNYYTTSQTIYDSQGSKHSMATYLYRSVDISTTEGERSFWYMKSDMDDGAAIIPDRPWLEFDDAGKLKLDDTREVIAADKELLDTSDKAITADSKWGDFNAAGVTYSFNNGETIVYTLNGTVAPTYTISTAVGVDSVQNFLDDIEAKALSLFAPDKPVKATIVEGRLALIDEVTGESVMSLSFGAGTSDAATAFGTMDASNPFGQEGRATAQNIIFDFAAQNSSWGNGGEITWDLTAADAPEVTSYAMDSRVNTMKNDGYPAGLLNSLDVGGDGIITGFFTNGQQQNLARIRTASFSSNDGLSKVGSYFTETNESGTPSIGNPGEGGLGKSKSHSLEISNTDVAREFIKMIAAQRAYQSSAKTITTTDEMLQELMQIKR